MIDELPDTLEKRARFKACPAAGPLTGVQAQRERHRCPGHRRNRFETPCAAAVRRRGAWRDAVPSERQVQGEVGDRRRRGKRPFEKERIQRIYPRFNIGRPTSLRDDMANLWKDPYRHWLFVPSASNDDPAWTVRTTVAHGCDLNAPRSTSCTSFRSRTDTRRCVRARHRAGSACAGSALPRGGG